MPVNQDAGYPEDIRLKYRFLDLRRPLPELLAELEAFRPTIVAAPPRLLRRLAEDREKDLELERHTVMAQKDLIGKLREKNDRMEKVMTTEKCTR